MPAPPERLEPVRRRRSAGWGAVAVVLLAATVVAGRATGAAPTYLNGSALATSPCGVWLANNSLTASVNEHYPNASLLPNASVAVANAISAWQSVCGSAGFQAAEAAGSNLSFAYSVQALDKNTTTNGTIIGSLFVTFRLGWTASCPPGSYPSGYPCDFTDRWDANLSTGMVAGPISAVASARLAACDTPNQNESDAYAIGDFYPGGPTEPSQAVASQELATMWGAICSSTAYFNILVSHPSAELSWSVWIGATTNATASPAPVAASLAVVGGNSPNATSGGLTFEWSLGWDAACPVHNGTYSNESGCYFSENWVADLVADTYTGPTETIAQGDSTPGPASSGAGGAAGNALSALGANVVLGADVVAGVAIVLAGVAVALRTPRRGLRP